MFQYVEEAEDDANKVSQRKRIGMKMKKPTIKSGGLL